MMGSQALFDPYKGNVMNVSNETGSVIGSVTSLPFRKYRTTNQPTDENKGSRLGK